MRGKILVIDDEPALRKLLVTTLSAHGFEVLEATDAREGHAAAIANRPDAILLDLGLPDRDGLSLLTQLREWYRNPILILSVRDQEETIVAALDKGADDYVTKPFNLNELIARIRVAQKHYLGESGIGPRTVGNLIIDLEKRQVTKGGVEVKLTSTEFELLKVLLKNAGKVMTHRQLLREVWGPNSSEHVQYLRVYLGHLRQKLEPSPHTPTLILTEPGVGYRFALPPPDK